MNGNGRRRNASANSDIDSKTSVTSIPELPSINDEYIDKILHPVQLFPDEVVSPTNEDEIDGNDSDSVPLGDTQRTRQPNNPIGSKPIVEDFPDSVSSTGTASRSSKNTNVSYRSLAKIVPINNNNYKPEAVQSKDLIKRDTAQMNLFSPPLEEPVRPYQLLSAQILKDSMNVAHSSNAGTSTTTGTGTDIRYSRQPPARKYSPHKSRPAFINKLWNMLNDSANVDMIRWSSDGKSFFVINRERFVKDILPKYFKHSNFASFVRQLNMYGWHKVQDVKSGSIQSNADEKWQFENEFFLRGREDLLDRIVRQKAGSSGVHGHGHGHGRVDRHAGNGNGGVSTNSGNSLIGGPMSISSSRLLTNGVATSGGKTSSSESGVRGSGKPHTSGSGPETDGHGNGNGIANLGIFNLRNRLQITDGEHRNLPNINDDVYTVLEELEKVKFNQIAISKDLMRISKDNEMLWKENILARERYRTQQQALEKIFRFLTSLVPHMDQKLLVDGRSNADVGNRVSHMNHHGTNFGKIDTVRIDEISTGNNPPEIVEDDTTSALTGAPSVTSLETVSALAPTPRVNSSISASKFSKQRPSSERPKDDIVNDFTDSQVGGLNMQSFEGVSNTLLMDDLPGTPDLLGNLNGSMNQFQQIQQQQQNQQQSQQRQQQQSIAYPAYDFGSSKSSSLPMQRPRSDGSNSRYLLKNKPHSDSFSLETVPGGNRGEPRLYTNNAHSKISELPFEDEEGEKSEDVQRRKPEGSSSTKEDDSQGANLKTNVAQTETSATTSGSSSNRLLASNDNPKHIDHLQNMIREQDLKIQQLEDMVKGMAPTNNMNNETENENETEFNINNYLINDPQHPDQSTGLTPLLYDDHHQPLLMDQLDPIVISNANKRPIEELGEYEPMNEPLIEFPDGSSTGLTPVSTTTATPIQTIPVFQGSKDSGRDVQAEEFGGSVVYGDGNGDKAVKRQKR